ncbi:MAG: endonuclease [Candidatus Riflebacteria bacterium]|nr:endonuclease [Candidatus Riflebacteria bacterium]
MIFNRKTSYLLLLVLFATALATSVTAQEEQSTENNRLRVHSEAVRLLEKIELESPRSHSDLVKLREKMQFIYDTPLFLNSGVSSDMPGLMLARRNSRSRNADWSAFYDSLKGLKDDELRARLKEKLEKQVALDYGDSRRYIMLKIDNHDSYVECVYTGKVLAVTEMPKPTVMNVEHTWPQSHGATGVAKGDLHHLFPTDPVANSTRSSLPFGNVDKPKWQDGGSECDQKRFEVRGKSRGNTARAIFYFATRYGKTISSGEEETLRVWHREDPVDADERARNDRVEAVQGNRNPFVDKPELVEYISDF